MTTSPALPPPLSRKARTVPRAISGRNRPWTLDPPLLAVPQDKCPETEAAWTRPLGTVNRWPRSVGGVTATPHPWNTLSWFHYLPKPDDREDHNSDRSTPAGNSAPGASGKAGV